MLSNGQLRSKLAKHCSDCSLRGLSVVAWGRNTSGQVGNFDFLVHENPVSLQELEGQNVSSISAAKHHSAAVADGIAWTWGQGQQGELGRGLSHEYCRPQRVESFVGQAEITQVALGTQHSLFLDTDGVVYSCGDNKQGQCGSGTKLEDIARQQRQEWERLMNADKVQPMSAGRNQPPQAARPHTPIGSPQAELTTPQMQQRLSMARKTPGMVSDLDARLVEVVKSTKMMENGNFKKGEKPRQFWDNAKKLAESLSNWNNYPARLGSDTRDILDDPNMTEDIGEVKQIAASKFFSALTMADGGIYTCGGGYCGELGSHRSWDTRAQSVEGEICTALEREGGAKEVAAGGSFCLALTNSGTVLSWGSLPGLPETRQRGRPRVLKITGLPPIKHIAAGWAHALLSDGSRVWTMGRWLTTKNEIRHGGQWGKPEEILELQGVKSMSAGTHSSAVVSDEGELYLWGKLINKEEICDLVNRHMWPHRIKLKEEDLWAGMGSDDPVRVPGLHKVQSIALGSQHALAILDF